MNDKKVLMEDGLGFVELVESFGNDLTVVNAARVSFNKESVFQRVEHADGSLSFELSDRDTKLVNFLAEHDHVTPFFHPQVRLRIKMPIFVAREWYRSTIGFARNEVSRRYVTTEFEFFVPKELRARDKNVKQGSRDEAVANNDLLVAQMSKYCREALEYYHYLLDVEQVCPEQARMVLPQSMYTEFIETASIAGYARLVNLRLERAAQKEIRMYAQAVANIIEPLFPASWKALIKVQNREMLMSTINGAVRAASME